MRMWGVAGAGSKGRNAGGMPHVVGRTTTTALKFEWPSWSEVG